MKSISLDFASKICCHVTENQKEIKNVPDIDRLLFFQYIPERYRDGNSYTWDFENETFAVNHDYMPASGIEFNEKSFNPKVTIPLKGLGAYYDEIAVLCGVEEYDTEDVLYELYADLLAAPVFDIDDRLLEFMDDEEA